MDRQTTWVLLLVTAFLAVACQPLPTQSPTAVPDAIGTTPLETAAEPTMTAVSEATPMPTPAPLAALVNGQTLLLEDFEQAVAQYQADLQSRGLDVASAEGQEELARAREWILNAMIEQILIEQAATAAGVVVSDADVDAYMQKLVEEASGQEALLAKLAEQGETYEGARRDVRAGLIGMAMTEQIIAAVPQTTEQVHARHILVDTPEKAQDILSQLRGGGDFVVMAQAHSLDISTKDVGGDLGFFPRGILVAPEVEEAAFGLQPGEISDVITSSLGYHIVQVIEREPAREVSAENLRLLQGRAVEEWAASLWSTANIERYVDATP